MEEFNLSKKRRGFGIYRRVVKKAWYYEEDVKEFIRRLKEKQYVWVTDNTKTGEGHYQISPIGIFIKVEDLDKLAGGKLKWKKK